MRLRGCLALVIVVVPVIFCVFWLQAQKDLYVIVQILALYLSIGMRSLGEHALDVADALANSDLDSARISVARIVSRDTDAMDASDIARAAIESVLENGSDAVFAPIFWFFLLGAPGAVLYRSVNTLDAMWGYKTSRYLHFGFAAARLDDLLNWLPARLTALTYTALGDSRNAWLCWRTQANLWYSPNAGPVMASGAGSLNLILGGRAVYAGAWKERPVLGVGRAPEAKDIGRAVVLVRKGLITWLIASFCLV